VEQRAAQQCQAQIRRPEKQEEPPARAADGQRRRCNVTRGCHKPGLGGNIVKECQLECARATCSMSRNQGGSGLRQRQLNSQWLLEAAGRPGSGETLDEWPSPGAGRPRPKSEGPPSLSRRYHLTPHTNGPNTSAREKVPECSRTLKKTVCCRGPYERAQMVGPASPPPPKSRGVRAKAQR